MRTAVLVPLLALLAVAACVPPDAARRVHAPSGEPEFVLIGNVDFDRAQGMVTLRLDPHSCEQARRMIDENGNAYVVQDRCPPFPKQGWHSARLVTPWGQSIVPWQGGPNGVSFKVDWTSAPVDPLGEGAEARLIRPWRIESPDAAVPFEWTPDEDDALAMLVLIGEATDTQVGVSEVSAAPEVEIVSFAVDGELRNGGSAELVLTVRNRGQGAAYRLAATSRSNVPALHGLDFSFGRLAPGATKTRRRPVTLPRANAEEVALVVLLFREAHQFAPEQLTGRFPVRRAVDVPDLGLACRFVGADAPRPMIDAGQTVQVKCEVRNEGAMATGVRVTGRLTGSTRQVTSGAFDLHVGRVITVSLAVQVPKDAAIDSELTLELDATTGSGSGTTARTQLVLVVARPRICPDGKLTREEFASRRGELRRKLDAGLLDRAEYEKYEAELVACLE